MAGAAFNSSRNKIPAPSWGRNSGVAHCDRPSFPTKGRPRKSTGSSNSARMSRNAIPNSAARLVNHTGLARSWRPPYEVRLLFFNYELLEYLRYGSWRHKLLESVDCGLRLLRGVCTLG